MPPSRALRRDTVVALLVCASVFVARASLADHYRVPSGSMEPTVAVGDQICVNKLAYGVRIPISDDYIVHWSSPAGSPERGDVVVLDSPADGNVLLKRVVAVPGDLVAVQDGQVVIDGTSFPVHQKVGGWVETIGGREHSLDMTSGGGPDLPSIRVPPRSYLVLGDNRGNSRDGRSFGWVTLDAILGRASAVCIHDGKPVWRGL